MPRGEVTLKRVPEFVHRTIQLSVVTYFTSGGYCVAPASFTISCLGRSPGISSSIGPQYQLPETHS